MVETNKDLTERLSEETIKKLKLDHLSQVSEEDLVAAPFVFLGLGTISLFYNYEIKQGDAQAAVMCGANSSRYLSRTILKSGHVSEIPKSSTHYFLGKKDTFEELNLRHSSDSHSYDRIPVVFLKK